MRLDIGRIKGEQFGYKRSLKVDLEIRLSDTKKGKTLSICGNIWNMSQTDIVTGGQIRETLQYALNHNEFKTLDITKTGLRTILNLWERWHLNDMNSGCEYQRTLIPGIEEEKGKEFFYAGNYTEVVKLPDFEECPICGYTYGSAWMFEKLPEYVVEYIEHITGGGN